MSPFNLQHEQNNTSIIIVNASGRMIQVFTPFLVEILYDMKQFKKGNLIYVIEVTSDPNYKLIYRIGKLWYPFDVFIIRMK